jgi:hypothetical protein
MLGKKLDAVYRKAVGISRMRHSGKIPMRLYLQRGFDNFFRVERNPRARAATDLHRTEDLERFLVSPYVAKRVTSVSVRGSQRD